MRTHRRIRKFERYLKKAQMSNVAKSSRRLFFNHLELSVEERGFFHVDQMYGMGSGVLIRHEGIFFLVTAKHVVENNIRGEFQNESPFWVTSKFLGAWETVYDFLWPKNIWNIGELIQEDIDYIDASDICLVEMFYPHKFHYPDHFIDIRDKNSVLSKNEFFEGQFLLVTGYPFAKNNFDYTPLSESYTHSTDICKHTIPGFYVPNGDFGHISFDLVEREVKHCDLNGMSGGAIYNVQPKANKIKLAGIPVTAGENVCRFIPCHLFIDAILNYRDSSFRVVDSAILSEPEIERQLKIYADYLREFDPKFSETKPKD